MLDFGGTTLMLAEEFPEYGILGPLTLGGTSVTMHLQVDDADAVIRRAAEAGAEIETEPEDQFYGERSGWLRDPSGHRWNVGHFLEEVTPEEMQRRRRHHAAAFHRALPEPGLLDPGYPRLLQLAENSEAPCSAVRALAARHLSDVRRKIEQLRRLNRRSLNCSNGARTAGPAARC